MIGIFMNDIKYKFNFAASRFYLIPTKPRTFGYSQNLWLPSQNNYEIMNKTSKQDCNIYIILQTFHNFYDKAAFYDQDIKDILNENYGYFHPLVCQYTGGILQHINMTFDSQYAITESIMIFGL